MKAHFMEALGMFADMDKENGETFCPPATSMNKMSFTEERLFKMLQNMETRFNNRIDKLSALNPHKSNDGGKKNSTVNPRTGQPWKRYCWTHGLVSYFGRDCKSKADGHQDNASFKNRMGGSTKGVLGT